VVTLVKDERGKPILKGTAFYDVGNVWRRVDEFGESMKSGVGVGIRVTTPIGPVRVDVGFPISQVADEKRKPRVHFNISRSF
jgi:outer membrane protein insertion porin family